MTFKEKLDFLPTADLVSVLLAVGHFAVPFTVATVCLAQDLKNKNMLVQFYKRDRLQLG